MHHQKRLRDYTPRASSGQALFVFDGHPLAASSSSLRRTSRAARWEASVAKIFAFWSSGARL